jgi:hypothetical protein
VERCTHDGIIGDGLSTDSLHRSPDSPSGRAMGRRGDALNVAVPRRHGVPLLAIDRRSQRARDVLTSAVQLGDLDMPPDEVQAIVAADQPAIVHRHIELHGERLAERLADQLQALARLERILSRAILERGHDVHIDRGP